MAFKGGLDGRIRWVGHVPFESVNSFYREADIFIFTSLRDTSGNVILEALREGVPVVCLDHQGAGDIVNCDCGFKIRVTRHKQVVKSLRDALVSVAMNRSDLETLSRGAIMRASAYLWPHNNRQIDSIYDQVFAEQLCSSSGARAMKDHEKGSLLKLVTEHGQRHR